MRNCKDCIHYEACHRKDREIPANTCRTFKDKSLILNLPCKVGDKVAVRACCECVETVPDNDECRYICPFEDDCECEDCDNENERIFNTEINSIFNNGFGWKITFKDLGIIEASFSDMGTSFFVGEDAEQKAKQYEQALKEYRNDCV